MPRVIMVWCCLLLGCATAHASESADGVWLERWLALSSDQRTAQRQQTVDQARRAGAANVAAAVAADLASDPKAARDDLDQRTSADPQVACWLRLQAARCEMRAKEWKSAKQRLLELRSSAPTPRLRYDVLLVLVATLEAQGGQKEVLDVRREVADLVRRELYAETCLDALPSPPPTEDDALRRLFDAATLSHAAGDLDAATTGYRRIIDRTAALTASSWATRSWIGLGWCEVQRQHVDQGEAIWLLLLRKQGDAPWCGQALLALVDVALADRLDPVLAEQRLTTLTKVPTIEQNDLMHCNGVDSCRSLSQWSRKISGGDDYDDLRADQRRKTKLACEFTISNRIVGVILALENPAGE